MMRDQDNDKTSTMWDQDNDKTSTTRHQDNNKTSQQQQDKTSTTRDQDNNKTSLMRHQRKIKERSKKDQRKIKERSTRRHQDNDKTSRQDKTSKQQWDIKTTMRQQQWDIKTLTRQDINNERSRQWQDINSERLTTTRHHNQRKIKALRQQQWDIKTTTRQDINNERSRQCQDINDRTSKKDQRKITSQSKKVQRKIKERSTTRHQDNNKTSRQQQDIKTTTRHQDNTKTATMRYQTYVWTHLSRSGVPSKGGVLIGCYSFPNVWLVWMLFCFKWLTTYWYGSWTAVSGEAHKAQSKQFSIVGGVLDQMLFFFKHVCSVWSIIMCVCPPCFCATHNFCNQSSSGTTMLVFIGLIQVGLNVPHNVLHSLFMGLYICGKHAPAPLCLALSVLKVIISHPLLFQHNGLLQVWFAIPLDGNLHRWVWCMWCGHVCCTLCSVWSMWMCVHQDIHWPPLLVVSTHGLLTFSIDENCWNSGIFQLMKTMQMGVNGSLGACTGWLHTLQLTHLCWHLLFVLHWTNTG